MIRLQPMIVGVFNFMEIWKNIPNYEGYYQVSNLGNVKSLPKKLPLPRGGSCYTKERILNLCINNRKYYIVSLLKNGTRKSISVHQLVAIAFLSHDPCGMKLVVDHINGIKTDNRVENLQVISQRENMSKVKYGGTSKYVGVYWNKNAKKWASVIRIKRKSKHLGYFNEEIEASKAYQNVRAND
jgi:hypothetical protein